MGSKGKHTAAALSVVEDGAEVEDAAKHAAPKRRNRPKGPEEKMEMIPRFIRSLEKTWTDNPELLMHYPDILAALTEARQVAVARNIDAAKAGDASAFGARLMGRLLGMAGQSVSELGQRGRKVIAEREELALTMRHPEAYRERIRREATEKARVDFRAENGHLYVVPVAGADDAYQARTGTDG